MGQNLFKRMFYTVMKKHVLFLFIFYRNLAFFGFSRLAILLFLLLLYMW